MEALGRVFEPWPFAMAGLLSSIAVAALLSLAVVPTAFAVDKGNRLTHLAHIGQGTYLAIVFGVLGWVTGYFTGASRESVVAEVMPAILGAIGAVGGFAGLKYGKAVQVGMMVAAFALCIFIGAATGSNIRTAHELMDQRLPPLSVLESEADKEASISEYRRKLGLPWPPAEGAGESRSESRDSVKGK